MKKFLSLIVVVLFALVMSACGKVTTYSLSVESELTMEVGDTKKINATYEGSTPVWRSSNDSVASVDDDGNVTANGKGTCTIYVALKDNEDINATVEVTVNEKPVVVEIESITIEGKKDEAYVGSEFDLTVVVVPSSEASRAVLESSNPSVATVTDGKVKALASGTTVISVKAGDKEDRFTLKVSEEPQEKDPEELYIFYSNDGLKIGETEELSVEILPKEANQEYVWSLDKEGIAIIEDNVIKGLKGGVVVVTATSVVDPNVKDSYTLRIYDNVEGMVIIGQSVMRPNRSQQLFVEIATVRPDGSEIVTNSDILWESLNPDIVSIESDGVATSLAGGKAIIRATALDSGGFVAEFEISVITVDITIGSNTYGSIQDAINDSKEGDIITIGKGSLNESFVINKSNITITGKEASLTGHIQFADGVENIKFYDIKFSGGGYIDSVSTGVVGIKNIVFDKVEFESVSSKVDGTIQFFIPVKGFEFTNSIARFTSYRGIRFEVPVEDVTITDCEFYGMDGKLFDMIRAMDLATGLITIANNTFTNTAQTFIQIRYIGDGTYNIIGNKFNNAAKACVDLRDAKEDNFSGKAIINVKENLFNGGANGWGSIRLRNSWYDGDSAHKLTNPSQVEVSINYNKFIGINLGDDGYYVDKPTDYDTEGLFNIDYNYSDLGSPKASWFNGMAKSFDRWFSSEEEMNKAALIDKINTDSKYLVVGTYEGITKTSYTTLSDALNSAKEGDVIVILPGNHSGSVVINIDNITITSLNGDLDPTTSQTRYEEAIFTSTITLAKGLKNCTISGIKFIDNAIVINEKGDSGTASNPATNLNGFNFINNIVETGTSSNGFIYFVEGDSGYSHNIIISNNIFKATSSFKGKALVYLDNNCDLTVTNNIFESVKADYAFYVHDTTKGLSGQFSILDGNTFKDITGSAMWINWLSALPNQSTTGEISIQGNTFENVTGEALHLGNMNNVDVYKSFKVILNIFTKVNTGIFFNRVSVGAGIECKFNTFTDVPVVAYIINNSANSSTSSPATLDATQCLFMDGSGNTITPDESKFTGSINYETTITGSDELPSANTLATAIKINVKPIYVGDKVQFDVTYTPGNTINTGVTWKSSDETIAKIDSDGNVTALKEGKVTITATYVKNNSVTDSVEITISLYQGVSISYSGNGILKIDDEITLTATATIPTTIEWSSSDTSIATVDENGKVKALKEGIVTITATLKDTVTKSSIVLQISNNEYSDLMQLLVDGHNAVVECKNINYIGYESGYESVPHKVYVSTNDYYAGEIPSITLNPCNNDTNSGKMTSIEYIVVHDTGAAVPSSTAKANSNWCTNSGNTGSSWHYTVGNDGIYKQYDDDVVAWHAGDGTSWSGSDNFYDTGVKADPNLRNRATVTLGSDGYFYVNGTKTNILLPSGATASTGTNRLGLAAIVKDGNYYLPVTWITSADYGSVVCIRGGNLHGIGIESAVNTGSDVYLTWQYLAKFVASLLVKHNLTPERVLFHNNFSNKTCPNTMINSNMVETFLDMVYLEYYVAKNYSDYTVTFISNNPDIIDNSGRVIGDGPISDTNVSYTIKITKGDVVEEVTLYSLVQGNH